MSGLAGKAALVTGAASGIGAAVAERMAADGADVFRADLSYDRAEPRILPLDVREEAAWEQSVAAVVEARGRLDVLVNCVGVSAASLLTDTTLAEWRHVIATNLDGAFLGTKHAVRAMRATGGAIVHVGSASGIRPAPGAAAYSTSKAALRMLVRTAAKECRDAGFAIRINLVSPAGVRTPMWRAMPFFRELVLEHGSEAAAYAAMAAAGGGRFLEPEVVAAAVCFLASDEAAHVTGAELPVDDGYVL